MKRCRRCHRTLKDPESIELGYGPVCRKKQRIRAYQLELRFNPAIDPSLSNIEKHRRVCEIIGLR